MYPGRPMTTHFLYIVDSHLMRTIWTTWSLLWSTCPSMPTSGSWLEGLTSKYPTLALASRLLCMSDGSVYILWAWGCRREGRQCTEQLSWILSVLEAGKRIWQMSCCASTVRRTADRLTADGRCGVAWWTSVSHHLCATLWGSQFTNLSTCLLFP